MGTGLTRRRDQTRIARTQKKGCLAAALPVSRLNCCAKPHVDNSYSPISQYGVPTELPKLMLWLMCVESKLPLPNPPAVELVPVA